jgi:hypothetical protein
MREFKRSIRRRQKPCCGTFERRREPGKHLAQRDLKSSRQKNLRALREWQLILLKASLGRPCRTMKEEKARYVPLPQSDTETHCRSPATFFPSWAANVGLLTRLRARLHCSWLSIELGGGTR